MSTIGICPPQRRHSTDPGSSKIELAAPPRRTETTPITGSLGMILVPAASGVGAVLLAVTQQSRPLLAAAGLLVLAASVIVGIVMVVGSRTGDRRRTREQRERYLDYLERVRQEVRDSTDRQLLTGRLNHPPPAAAVAAVHSVSRLWERRPGDSDFLALRIGLGPVPQSRPLRLGFQPDDPVVSYDEVCLSAARALVGEHGQLADQPIVLPLRSSLAVSIRGGHEEVRGAARALLAQLVWAHSPLDAGVVLISAAPAAHWDWLKWLPHNQSGFPHRGMLRSQLTASTISHGMALLSAETDLGSIAHHLPARKLVVFVEISPELIATQDLAALHAAARTVGAVLILLSDRQNADGNLGDIRVTAANPSEGSIEWIAEAVDPTQCLVDQLDVGNTVLLAKSFAPLRPARAAAHAAAGHSVMDSVRQVDVSTLNPLLTWRRRDDTELLQVPIGVGADGDLVSLDLKESAAGGTGPHGLVVGATGSGKSELLRTLVTALVISHPPEALALLLADFKGGATFSGLAALPHVAGIVTNLEADLGLVDRFRDALLGELQRRQELLAAGKVSSIDGYQQLQRLQTDLPTLPRLLVIVDEFSELLSVKPDLAEMFTTIGRIGRSIGIHLLLATQRLDTGRIRGLESHLSYRICLRTFSEAESREAIGSPAAYRLPAEPGWAYLSADSAAPVRFRASTVSRPYRPVRSPRRSAPVRIMPFLVENDVAQRISALAGRAAIDSGAGPAGNGSAWRQEHTATILDVIVDRLTAGALSHPQGRPVRPVWLEPLPARLEIGELPSARWPAVRPHGAGPPTDGSLSQPPQEVGLLVAGRPDHSLQRVRSLVDRPLETGPPADGLIVPLGLVDIPERQRQDILNWDFDAGNGNLLIVGAGRSGKSVAVGTLLCSLATCYQPGDIEVWCMDFGGESLLGFRDLPHVAMVATRSDPELTRLVFSRLSGTLDEREALFREHRFDSVTALRRARRARTMDQTVPGAVVLIIDGWAGLRDADSGVEAALDDVLGRGPGLGVHTVLTISAAGQLRTRLAAGFAGRIEFRLGDSFDSVIDRRLAKALPADRPGRALATGSHYAQIALPLLNGSQLELVEEIRRQWPGPGVPRIKTLPTVIPLTEIKCRLPTLRADKGGPTGCQRLVLGVTENDLAPLEHSLSGPNPHLLIYGDTGSGKTSFLRSVLSQMTACGPDHLAIDSPNGRHGLAGSAAVDVSAARSSASASWVAAEGSAGEISPAADRAAVGSASRGLAAPSSAAANLAADGSASRGSAAPSSADGLALETITDTDEVLAIDYRRGLPPGVANYRRFTRTSEVAALCAALSSVLTARLSALSAPPGGNPEIYLLIDDYELVGSPAGNPLIALLPFLAHARDIGFHLVLARRSGGAARAQYEPLLQALGDLGTPVLLLSGAPTEGRLGHGLAPRPFPPGRAQFAMRGTVPRIIQIGWTEPDPT